MLPKKIKVLRLHDGFYVKVRIGKSNGSNYNTMASVYKHGDNTPLFGTSFKDAVSNEGIKQWANDELNTLYHYEKLDNQE